jgi:cell division protein ZapA (FtsZ GTPase activity inhibitor)
VRPAARLARAGAFAIACAWVQPAALAAEPAPRVVSAIHLATLAERIAKLHAQVGQGVLAERSRRALADAARDFDATLKEMSARAPGAELRDNYALLALLWQDYRDWAMRAPTRDNARKLRPRTEEVAWIASKGAKLVQENARGSTSAAAVRAANAATLAQRIAKLHLWMRWEIRDDALALDLRESAENLRRALDALQASPGNSAEVAEELQSVASQMSFMEDAARALERREGSARAIEFIAKTGDHIYESMERLARLYEGAPGS